MSLACLVGSALSITGYLTPPTPYLASLPSGDVPPVTVTSALGVLKPGDVSKQGLRVFLNDSDNCFRVS